MPAPAFPPNLSLPGLDVGVPYHFAICATGNPTSYGIVGFGGNDGGLSTALVSGGPMATMQYNWPSLPAAAGGSDAGQIVGIDVTATNASGSATASQPVTFRAMSVTEAGFLCSSDTNFDAGTGYTWWPTADSTSALAGDFNASPFSIGDRIAVNWRTPAANQSEGVLGVVTALPGSLISPWNNSSQVFGITWLTDKPIAGSYPGWGLTAITTASGFMAAYVTAAQLGVTVPDITSAASLAATFVTGLTPYQIVSTGGGSVSATGLPEGLYVNGSGQIAGTPYQFGFFPVILSSGTYLRFLDLFVDPGSYTPTILASSTTTAIVGNPFIFSATSAEASPTWSLQQESGMSLAIQAVGSGGISALVTGSFAAPGLYGFSILNTTAASGVEQKDVTVSVSWAAPVVTLTYPGLPFFANNTFSLIAGQPVTWQLAASGYPTSWTITGLPAGMTYDAGTAIISGTPTTTGTGSFTATATNGTGTGPEVFFNFAVSTATAPATPPAIQQPQLPTLTAGLAFNYQLYATNFPTLWTATLLPGGLALNEVTGAITGSVQVPGTYVFTVICQNGAGLSAPCAITLTVNAPANSAAAGSLPQYLPWLLDDPTLIDLQFDLRGRMVTSTFSSVTPAAITVMQDDSCTLALVMSNPAWVTNATTIWLTATEAEDDVPVINNQVFTGSAVLTAVTGGSYYKLVIDLTQESITQAFDDMSAPSPTGPRVLTLEAQLAVLLSGGQIARSQPFTLTIIQRIAQAAVPTDNP